MGLSSSSIMKLRFLLSMSKSFFSSSCEISSCLLVIAMLLASVVGSEINCWSYSLSDPSVASWVLLDDLVYLIVSFFIWFSVYSNSVVLFMSCVFSRSSSIVGSVERIVAIVYSKVCCLCVVVHVGTSVLSEFNSSERRSCVWNMASWRFVC